MISDMKLYPHQADTLRALEWARENNMVYRFGEGWVKDPGQRATDQEIEDDLRDQIANSGDC